MVGHQWGKNYVGDSALLSIHVPAGGTTDYTEDMHFPPYFTGGFSFAYYQPDFIYPNINHTIIEMYFI